VGSDGFEKVLIGTRGARETLLRGRKVRAAKNSVLTSGVKQLGAESFNQPLNDWNVSNVTNMNFMFQNARSFNQPLHAPWYHEESEDECSDSE